MTDTSQSNSSAEDRFKVIALTVSVGDKHEDCSVIKADAVFPTIYSEVFGPASLEECEKWLQENCSCRRIVTARKKTPVKSHPATRLTTVRISGIGIREKLW